MFGILTGAYTNPALDMLEASLSPRLAAHRDAIYLNRALYTRVHQLYENRAKLGLDAESLRLLERYHLDFVRAGAQLSSAEQDALKAMNAELATLSTQFKQNLLKETNASAVLVETREELAGLSDATIASAASAAKAAGHEGKYLLRLTNTTGQPAYSALESRALRAAHHGRFARPRQPRRRIRQQRDRDAHRQGPRRARPTARLSEPCGL